MEARWHDFRNNQQGDGTTLPYTDATGLFWFFAPGNVELIVKVLDGCALNEKFWVFAGGLTDVKVTLTVTDLLSGFDKTYVSTAGAPFQPLQDTSAIPTCPSPP